MKPAERHDFQSKSARHKSSPRCEPVYLFLTDIVGKASTGFHHDAALENNVSNFKQNIALGLREREVSARWGVPVRTLQQWRWRGRGPEYVKVGKMVIYPVQSLDEFFTAQIIRPSDD